MFFWKSLRWKVMMKCEELLLLSWRLLLVCCEWYKISQVPLRNTFENTNLLALTSDRYRNLSSNKLIQNIHTARLYLSPHTLSRTSVIGAAVQSCLIVLLSANPFITLKQIPGFQGLLQLLISRREALQNAAFKSWDSSSHFSCGSTSILYTW